jgi:hypothetical protein
MTRAFLLGFCALGLAWLAPVDARAHCDAIDGPVATAAQRALETGNVNLALPYAPAEAEAEIIARFEESRRVRRRGGETRGLADRAFVENVVRLHRMGEGASYTGLRPAGGDFGPVIPAAEAAIESGDLTHVQALLTEEIEHGLAEKFTHVQATRNVSSEPRGHDQVAAARERVNAELGFITYAETLRQSIHAAATAHHED